MALKQEYDPKKEIAAISQKCLGGKGFVLFVGVVTDRKDKDGNFILDFQYTRHKFPFEDLSKSMLAFRDHCMRDALSVFGTK